MAEEIYGFDESKSKVTLKSGAGITVGEDGTIGHTNEMEASASYVGGTTAVPMIKIDEQGHVVGLSKQTIYPPTTAGTAGQVWTSDGAGAGKWADAPGGGDWIIASDISEVISGTTVLYDFEVMYMYVTSASGWISISAGEYAGSRNQNARLGATMLGNTDYKAYIEVTSSSTKVVIGSVTNATLSTTINLYNSSSYAHYMIRYKA